MAYDFLLNVQPIEVTGTGVFENERYTANGAKVFASISITNASVGATTSIVVEESIDGVTWSPMKMVETDKPFIAEPYFTNEVPEKGLSFVDNVAGERFKFKTQPSSKKFRFSYDVVGTATIEIKLGNS